MGLDLEVVNERAAESASFSDDALRLPVDSYPLPGATRRRRTYRFTVSAPPMDVFSARRGGSAVEPDVLLATVFGILLARWTVQSSIPVRASRWSVSGECRCVSSMRLRITTDTTCLDVLAQAEAELARFDVSGVHARPPSAASGSNSAAGGGAAFSWVESRSDDESDATKPVPHLAEECVDEALHLVVTRTGGLLCAAFVYDADLFRPTTIERFSGHLGVVLAAVLERPEAAVFGLPLLTEPERRDIEAVCDGRRRLLPTEPVHERIEHRTAAAPDAVAVRYRDRCLSYAELNARANRLSHWLIAEHIGAESRVVVAVEPGFEILIALLAILKAGAVYVPLDPAYPAARIQTILEDTRPKVVITSRHLASDPMWGDVPTLALDAAGELDDISSENAALCIEPDRTAYVFYTSGTTGKPKGVMASHANLTSYVTLARERYDVTSRDVVPAIARFSFSISLFELVVPLSAGGTLILLDRDHVVNPARMAATLQDVTLFHAGPSLLRGLLPYVRRHHQGLGHSSGVRHVSSGGDMIPAEVLEEAKDVFPNAEVFVIYGCSEIACMGCTYLVPRDRPLVRTFVGRPFDAVGVRVLDRAFNLLPVGVVGEVFVSGSGVAKGYLNLPELTAERFVNLEGRRFYRTGDMGRLSEDGCLELVGRSDFQVKIRGMRVELGEIEHHLRRAPGIREGVVTAREGPDGEKMLVAYVVGESAAGEASAQRDLAASTRRHMAAHLPDYMVPAVYVELASLPLNHNFKVDRRALPDPRRADGPSHRAPNVRAPESPTEILLASLWRRLLGVDVVGLGDNFFDLGGHSLLALKLIVEVDRALDVELDGLEVLRESLEVQASICDERLGTRRAASSLRLAPEASDSTVETFHFGAGQTLYGVLHRPAGAMRNEAVMVCGPTGHEHVRAHFVLRRLAERLSARGVPVLRFDYYGCGDSLGASIDGSCLRWQRDIVDALAEVRARTGTRRVTAVGVRLGATLLWNLGDGLDVERQVFWDPICDGAEYVAEMTSMHRRALHATSDRWFRRRPRAASPGTNLLGSTYSDAALAELRGLSMKPKTPRAAGPNVPIRWLSTSPSAHQGAAFQRVCAGTSALHRELPDVDCAWHDLERLEDVLPDVGIAGALSTLIAEGP